MTIRPGASGNCGCQRTSVRRASSLEQQRKQLEEIGKELGVKQMNDWYKVSRTEIQRRVSFIGHYYQGNVQATLSTLFPEHLWNPSQFSTLPMGYWKNLDHQRKKLEEIGMELGVKQ